MEKIIKGEEFHCNSWFFRHFWSRWSNGLSIWFEISTFPWAISLNLGKLCLYLYFQDRSFGVTLVTGDFFAQVTPLILAQRVPCYSLGAFFRLDLKNGSSVGYVSFFKRILVTQRDLSWSPCSEFPSHPYCYATFLG